MIEQSMIELLKGSLVSAQCANTWYYVRVSTYTTNYLVWPMPLHI